jgi:hypothetical protein
MSETKCSWCERVCNADEDGLIWCVRVRSTAGSLTIAEKKPLHAIEDTDLSFCSRDCLDRYTLPRLAGSLKSRQAWGD